MPEDLTKTLAELNLQVEKLKKANPNITDAKLNEELAKNPDFERALERLMADKLRDRTGRAGVLDVNFGCTS